MYKKKYIKYKIKYLELKKQSGGDCNENILDGIEPITREPYKSRRPEERITIGEYCYFVREIYEWIFRFNTKTGNPHMIDLKTENIISRSDLEKLIVAYFKAYPKIGLYYIPGYISFDDMISRARDIALPLNITTYEIDKLTLETNKIIAETMEIIEKDRIKMENLSIAREEKNKESEIKRLREREAKIERDRIEREQNTIIREEIERKRIEKERERTKEERERIDRERIDREREKERERREKERERIDRIKSENLSKGLMYI
jgi:hypothetical protein